MMAIELFNERLKLRLIEFSDLMLYTAYIPLSGIEYNTGVPEVLPLQKIITPLISDVNSKIL
jgi:hypothetical protein